MTRTVVGSERKEAVAGAEEGTLVMRRGDALAEQKVARPDDHVARSLRSRSSSTEICLIQFTPAGHGPLAALVSFFASAGFASVASATGSSSIRHPLSSRRGVREQPWPPVWLKCFDARVALLLRLFRLRMAYGWGG